MYFGKIKPKNNERIPPDQNVTTAFPVLHHGNVPYYKKGLSDWNLQIFGEVEQPITYSFEQLLSLDAYETNNDIHCVTGWSKLDNSWKGVAVNTLLQDVKVLLSARFVIIHAEEGWTTNVPIDDFMKETSLLAHTHNGVYLTPEHGFPLRAVIPHLYFWKSAKWVRKIEFSKEDRPGFWEKNGYHNYGDPWRSQRFSFD